MLWVIKRQMQSTHREITMETKSAAPVQPVAVTGASNLGIFLLEEDIRKVGEGIHSAAIYADARDALVKAIAEVCHLSGVHSGSNLERVLGRVESATPGEICGLSESLCNRAFHESRNDRRYQLARAIRK